MQAADAGLGDEGGIRRRARLDCPLAGGVFRKPEVGPVVVVVGDVLAHEPQDVLLAERNYVIEQVAATRQWDRVSIVKQPLPRHVI